MTDPSSNTDPIRMRREAAFWLWRLQKPLSMDLDELRHCRAWLAKPGHRDLLNSLAVAANRTTDLRRLERTEPPRATQVPISPPPVLIGEVMRGFIRERWQRVARWTVHRLLPIGRRQASSQPPRAGDRAFDCHRAREQTVS